MFRACPQNNCLVIRYSPKQMAVGVWIEVVIRRGEEIVWKLKLVDGLAKVLLDNRIRVRAIS